MPTRVLKPFDEDRFAKALGRARKALSRTGTARDQDAFQPQSGDVTTEAGTEFNGGHLYLERIIIRSGGRVFFRRTDEIDWIEAEGNYVRLHSGESAFLMRETIGSLEARLDPARFARVHRSAIVQIRKIREIEISASGSYKLLLENGAQILMSRRYRRRLPKTLLG